MQRTEQAHLQGSLERLHLRPRPAQPPLERGPALLQVLRVRARGLRLPPPRIRVLERSGELDRGPRVGGLQRRALRGFARNAGRGCIIAERNDGRNRMRETLSVIWDTSCNVVWT